MKKILFLLLALLAVCSAALAERGVIDFTRTGIRFNAPEVFLNAEGGALMSRYDYGEMTDGVLIGVMPYLGHTEAETQALYEAMNDMDRQEADETWAKFYSQITELFFIFGIEPPMTIEEGCEKVLVSDAPVLPPVSLGMSNGYDYYLVAMDFTAPRAQSKIQNFPQALKDEVAALAEYVQKHPECFEFIDITPEFQLTEAGTHVSFEAVDLNGDPVKSDALFAANKVTMVNIWRTSCHYCVDEFPEIEEMSKAWAEKGGAVVTYCADTRKNYMIDWARKITADYSFRTLTQSDSFEAVLPFQSTPITYFVDSNGVVLGDAIDGVDLEAYDTCMTAYLNDETVAPEDSIVPEAGAVARYTAHVVDQHGDPVPDASLTFCNANACNLVTTDENGMATFEGRPFAYHIQVVDLPDGYSETDAEYYTGLRSGTLMVEVVRE